MLAEKEDIEQKKRTFILSDGHGRYDKSQWTNHFMGIGICNWSQFTGQIIEYHSLNIVDYCQTNTKYDFILSWFDSNST